MWRTNLKWFAFNPSVCKQRKHVNWFGELPLKNFDREIFCEYKAKATLDEA